MGNNISDGGSTDEGPVTFEKMQIRTKETGGELVIVHQVVVLHVQVLGERGTGKESCKREKERVHHAGEVARISDMQKAERR